MLLFGLPVMALLLTGCPDISRELIVVRVDGVTIRVSVAATDDTRRRGLMQRQHLEENEGMLFVYPDQKILRLWMLDTPLPLDAGFFDRDGVMVGHLSMRSDGGMHTYASPAPAMYALEMSHGWFVRNGITPGARLALPYTIEGR